MNKKIKAVVFDLDGTLVDSKLDFSELRRRLGWPEHTLILEHLATLGCALKKQQAERIIIDFELEGARNASWMPNADLLLQQLKHQNMPMAILTRNMRQATELCMQALNIPIDLVLTRDDAPAKPQPEGLWLIAEQLGVTPDQILYVGDYLFDIQTARNAGAYCCLYRYGDNHIYAELADVVVDDLLELADWLHL
ncbi:haloacid dehalogenase superfamily enzyme, subfamily IA [Rheinheimera sp. A13L]|uniref:HAD family hydrolase n=1 Tax=Rheinheimera sp. A13L TaxID=506534 RepID=UPI0002124AC5|nr:HAD-IA family hydrolase [Rheinheimera sp. A13L]EGM76365.1 haloacid dehalogenase superfamily enzyme, subfamily IA [Rheinheimera sp. A13L]